MITRFKSVKVTLALSCLLCALSIGATGANAGEIEPFSQSAFEEAQAKGESFLLDFHASWCPTCRVQAKVINKLIGEKQFSDMRFFVVNYDKEDALKRQLKVSKQSTLVIFKGAEEQVRLTGIIAEDQIRSLLRKGL